MFVRSACCSLLLLLAIMAPPAGAQSFLAWKGLSRGPYSVGFSTATVEDLTRTLRPPADYLGRPRPAYGRRPIHIAVWHPAGAGGVEMTYGDYPPLMAWDTGPEAEGAAERAVTELRYTQTVTPQAGPPDQASIDRLRSEKAQYVASADRALAAIAKLRQK